MVTTKQQNMHQIKTVLPTRSLHAIGRKMKKVDKKRSYSRNSPFMQEKKKTIFTPNTNSNNNSNNNDRKLINLS